jgi:tetratricopeptide (TPR) repeat protein
LLACFQLRGTDRTQLHRMTSDDKLDEILLAAESASESPGSEPLVAELLSSYLLQRSRDYEAWLLMGDTLRGLWRFREAEDALHRVRIGASEELQASAMIRLGMVMRDTGRRAEADEWFAEGIRNRRLGEHGWVWILRGANLAVAGEFGEAEASHRRATELEGYRDEAYLNLGLVLRAQRRYHEAASAFEQSLSLCPDYVEAREALDGLSGIWAALELAARIATEDLGAANSDLLEAARTEGKAASEKPAAEAVAAELLGAYVSRRPWDAYATYVLGESLRVVGRNHEAKRVLCEAAESAPNEYQSNIVARLGMIDKDLGNHVEAEALFQRAIAGCGGDAPAWMWNCRGANLVAAGDRKLAETCFRHAINGEGDTDDQRDAHYSLARILRSERRYGEAAGLLAKVLERWPGLIEIQDVLRGVESALEVAQTSA